MNPRSQRQAVGLALLLTMLLGSLLASGCSPSPKVSLELDPRVFTLFAGLVAVGYDEGQLDPASETLRAQLEEALAEWTADDLYPMTWLQNTYGPNALVSAALQLGPPPDFAIELEPVSGLRVFFARLWLDVEPLYDANGEAGAQALEAMAHPAADAIYAAIDYAGGESPCRMWRVVPESLVLPGCPYSYRSEGTAWIVVSRAADSWRSDLTREVFRVLVHDELTQLDSQGALERFQPLLERVRFDSYPEAYVEESLAWALTARTLDSADKDAMLDAATKEGFALAHGLCDKLADYEASGKALTSYLDQLLASVDVDVALAAPTDLSLPEPWEWEWIPFVEGGGTWTAAAEIRGALYYPISGTASQTAFLNVSPTPVGFGIQDGTEDIMVVGMPSILPDQRAPWPLPCTKGEIMCQVDGKIWVARVSDDWDDWRKYPILLQAIMGEG